MSKQQPSADGRQRIVVGTAGHIDHGKTSLVAALTGTDCDRWIEEKERGITIDIGFAHLAAETASGDPLQISFVDVPGHERFVHNALAGLGGIRLMMMVVAADEGVKPQTREHLAICSLLDIPRGIVVLTKSDLVDPETLELAQLELEEELAGGPFDGAPMVAVSAKTGAGIEQLQQVLLELAAAAEPNAEMSERALRLPVDRAFNLPGLGVVVTGTQHSGQLHVGDSLEVLPPGSGGEVSARVRSLQVHGEARDLVTAGERVSAQLTGVDLDQVARGTVLATRNSLPTSRILLVRYRHLTTAPQDLKKSTEIRLHQFTSETIARIRPLSSKVVRPGDEAICVVYAQHPLSVQRGDRFIVRRPSPAATIGGGEVLDPQWRKPRGRNLTEHLEQLCKDTASALEEWIVVGREAGATAGDLARRAGIPAQQLDRLVDSGAALEAPANAAGERRFVAPGKVLEVGQRAKDRLKAFFKKNRLAAGIPKAEVVSAVLPKAAQDLGPTYLDWLAAGKVLVLQGDRVNLPGRATGITDEESALATRISALYRKEGLTPRSPAELQRELGAAPKVFEGLLRYLTQQRKVVRLPSGLFLSQEALDGLKADVLAEPWTEITVGAFKEHFGLSRKWAIPLLEYLDSQQVTRRRGDVRLVLRR